MSDNEIITAIRAQHLKKNIRAFEGKPGCTLHWRRAHVDPGGTIFGPGPYVKLPITVTARSHWGVRDELTIRVYPTARLRRRLGSAPRGDTDESI
jgi:hypothetical protein